MWLRLVLVIPRGTPGRGVRSVDMPTVDMLTLFKYFSFTHVL